MVMRLFSSIIVMMQLVFLADLVRADGEVNRGRDLSISHCARCHVIGDYNKFGGIGSTPSFQLIAGMSDGLERFETFFERRPHPAFVRIAGAEKQMLGTAYATQFMVTADSIVEIIAFVKTLKKKDLSKIPVMEGFGRKTTKR